jgi:outer membrane protein assembly factor BamB
MRDNLKLRCSTMLKRAVFCAALCAAATLGGAAWADDEGSAAFQIDPAHDGNINFSAGFSAPLSKAWATNLGARLTYPLVANGLVFIVGYAKNPTLFALDIKTGALVWQKSLVKGHWAYAACDNGRVFTLDYRGTLTAFSADANGSQLWQTKIQGHRGAFFVSSLVATGGKIFLEGIGGSDTNIYAFDETTGKPLWHSSTDQSGGGGGGGPAVGDGGVFLSHAYRSWRWDVETGAPIWYDNWNGEGGSSYTQVYFQNQIYSRDIAAADHLVLDAASGKIAATFAGVTPPAFWTNSKGKALEIIQDDWNYKAVDPRTGNLLWTFAGDGQLTSAPIVINGLVAAQSQLGHLYLLDAASGKQVWTYDMGGSGLGVPDERNWGALWGMGAGDGMLLYPWGNTLVAFAPSAPKKFAPPAHPR